MGNAGRDSTDHEIHAFKDTVGGHFGLVREVDAMGRWVPVLAILEIS